MHSQTKVKSSEHARAIVSEAKGYGLDVGVPETEEELVVVANQIYEYAVEAQEGGMNGEHINTIIKLTENYIPLEKIDATGALEEGIDQARNGEISSVTLNEVSESAQEETVPAGTDDDEREPDDKAFYHKSIEERISENIPVPPEIEGNPPNLPIDLNDLSDKEVMRLHGAFTACSARVSWLYAVEEAGESAARLVSNKKISNYIANAEKKDSETNKPKTMEVLKAEARWNDPEIDYWKSLQEKHEVSARKYHAAAEIFNNNVERISRHWTMRTQERG